MGHAQQKRWHVQPHLRNSQRGYEGIKLRRARRCQPGYEFGGQVMLQRVANFMSVNPPPVPPIEVSIFSFTETKVKYFSALSTLLLPWLYKRRIPNATNIIPNIIRGIPNRMTTTRSLPTIREDHTSSKRHTRSHPRFPRNKQISNKRYSEDCFSKDLDQTMKLAL